MSACGQVPTQCVKVTGWCQRKDEEPISVDEILSSRGDHVWCESITHEAFPHINQRAHLLLQWLNQSHNACVNYSNRNASKVQRLQPSSSENNASVIWRRWNLLTCFSPQPAPVSKFVQGYLGAVTSAVSIAVSSHNASALIFQCSDVTREN